MKDWDCRHAILKTLSNALKHLSWKCEGCPQIDVCGDQPDGGEPRYCWPIIKAAILGNEKWDTEHRGQVDEL